MTRTCVHVCVWTRACVCRCQMTAEICSMTKVTLSSSEWNCSCNWKWRRQVKMLWPAFHSSVSTEPHGRVPLLRLLKEPSISGSVQVNCWPSTSYFYAARTPEDVKHAKQKNLGIYFGWAVLWKVLESCCVSILSCCAPCPVFIFKVFKRKAEDSNNFLLD